jgi:hypothetical protein
MAVQYKDMQRLERMERMMIRWMCEVTLKDRKASLLDFVRHRRLRCFGHLERKEVSDFFVHNVSILRYEDRRGEW